MAGDMEQLSPENIRALASLSNFANDADLRSITSYEDAVALAEQVHGTVIDIAQELGSGFALIDDKDRLCGTEFVIIQWRFSAGDFGTFVSAGLVTKHGEKFIVNDGSSGMMDQLLQFSQATQRFGGMKVPRGLRKSEYSTCPDCGKPMSREEIACDNAKCLYEGDKRGLGTTYYLDTAAAAN